MNEHPPIRKQQRKLTRRDFLSVAWWLTFGALATEGGAMTGLFMWPKIKPGGFGSVVSLGPVEEIEKIPVGDMQYFKDAQLYLTRLPSGVMAMWRKCPHLGCVVPWRPDEPSADDVKPRGRFNCPCHGSIYDRYGRIIAGPAPRPLDLFPVEVKDGVVRVDTEVVIQRQNFEERQVFKI